MQRDRQYLADLLNATARVDRFIEGYDLPDFLEDEKTQSAVIHQLIAVGEAANRLSSELRERHSHIPWQLTVDMRNALAHQYSDLNLERIWRVAVTSISSLRRKVLIDALP